MTKSYLADVAAALLILLAPLINVLVESRYRLLSPELLMIYAGALLVACLVMWPVPRRPGLARIAVFAGLVLLFVDLQYDLIAGWNAITALAVLVLLAALWVLRRHAGAVLLAVFATINAATLLKPVLASWNDDAGGPRAAASGAPDELILHIVLDEHIGLAGMPDELPGAAGYRSRLTAFLAENGFTVYPRAYSRHFYSIDSISEIMNADSDIALDALYDGKPVRGYTLTENHLFDYLREQGYHIAVLQSAFIDLCREGQVADADCVTYHHRGIDDRALASLATGERALLIVRAYEQLSFLAGEARRLYEAVRIAIDHDDSILPSWTDWNGRTHPMATFRAFDDLGDLVMHADGPSYIFAHILGTHYPYIYRPDCKIRRPLFDWRDPEDPPPTHKSRAELYPLYFDQLHCMLSLMDELFERMKKAGRFDHATILVHGDHGSRIVVNKPSGDTASDLTTSDLIDGYSTLVAIRRPGETPQRNTEMRSLTDIVRIELFDLPPLARPGGPHIVHLRGPGTALSTHELTTFPRGVIAH